MKIVLQIEGIKHIRNLLHLTYGVSHFEYGHNSDLLPVYNYNMDIISLFIEYYKYRIMIMDTIINWIVWAEGNLGHSNTTAPVTVTAPPPPRSSNYQLPNNNSNLTYFNRRIKRDPNVFQLFNSK